jgi:hypothetical protein
MGKSRAANNAASSERQRSGSTSQVDQREIRSTKFQATSGCSNQRQTTSEMLVAQTPASLTKLASTRQTLPSGATLWWITVGTNSDCTPIRVTRCPAPRRH